MKEVIELDFIKIKHLCSVKATGKKMRRQDTDWEKILYLLKEIADKDCYSKSQRILKNSTIRRQLI